ncbi:MAG TPA: NAD(P)-dependent oxidoreductase [Nakamurella sp.]|nr:NAD(P)-dependent oxidoreductase [Nakamurella sp.]
MRVTVLGTGIMGSGVARSLLRAGHQVTVWNRDATKSDPLGADGATVATDPADAVKAADAVLTVLFDADAVIAVMSEALGAMPESATWAQLSTIGLDGTARVAKLAERHGVAVVEAMMLGTKTPAEQGQLVLLVSGDRSLLERLDPVFEAIGSRAVNAGGRLGQASALKLTANAWVGSITALVGQSLAMAGGLGLDPQLFLDAIIGGATDTPYAHVKGAAMQSGSYEPSFTIDGVLKDLDLIRSAAQTAGVPDELLQAVQGKFEVARRSGHGSDDMAAVYTAFLPAG